MLCDRQAKLKAFWLAYHTTSKGALNNNFCQENSWMIAFNFACLSHNNIGCTSEQCLF